MTALFYYLSAVYAGAALGTSGAFGELFAGAALICAAVWNGVRK
jgi:hypothetical protein